MEQDNIKTHLDKLLHQYLVNEVKPKYWRTIKYKGHKGNGSPSVLVYYSYIRQVNGVKELMHDQAIVSIWDALAFVNDTVSENALRH